MSNTSPFAPLNPTTKPKQKKSNQSFVEALKSIGSNTAKSIKQDVMGGVGRDSLQSLTGGGNPNAASPFENSGTSAWGNNEWLKQREEEIRQQERAKRRHQELTAAKPLFDRRQEEVKAKIEALQEELRALAVDMANLGSSLQRAIDEEVVSPGAYHVSYFEKLKSFIANLRKQVNDSQNWLAISADRKAAKNSYWGNVKKSGTKYMLSEERSKATQAG